MLVIRLSQGWTLKLDRKINDGSGFGVWEFHRSESSYTFPQGLTYQTLRHARIKPPEPAEGAAVEVIVCGLGGSEEDWRPVGRGVASYHSER